MRSVRVEPHDSAYLTHSWLQCLFGYYPVVFIDARHLEPGSHVGESAFAAEVCVIGAGAAGITLALELSRAGREVVLLESGGFDFEQDVQQLYAGNAGGTFLEPEELYLSRSRVRRFGGTTSHWNGWCRPLDADDFEVRDWIPDSGWPIRRSDLDPYYQRAAEYLDIGSLIQGGPQFFEGDPEFESVYFLLSSPTRFGLKYRSVLAETARTKVILHASAVQAQPTADERAVKRIAASTLDGKRFEVAARHFVLACGGVENARVLLAFNRQQDGIRVPSPALGRYFMDHPIGRVGRMTVALGRRSRMRNFEAIDRPHQPGGARGVVRPRSEVERRQRWSRVLFVFESEGWWNAGEFAPAVARAGMVSARKAGVPGEMEGAPYFGTVAGVVEQRPNPASRVMLDEETDALGIPRVRLDWRLGADDESTLGEAVGSLQRRLGASFEGRMQNRFVAADPWRRAGGSNHHMGTTRMGTSVRESVVDRDCRIHGLDNLHVAGSSVFPTSGTANPTYTIVGLAIRLADRLNGVLA